MIEQKIFCKECKKRIPNEIDTILDPCVCKDYREQFAKTKRIMPEQTMAAFMKNRRMRDGRRV